MASLNKIFIMGNLTRDPEYRQLPSGQALCKLGLATNRSYKNRQTGALIQEVCYVDVDVWGVQAESCRQYLEKGRTVLIEGRLKLDTWDDQSGQKRSKHSIVAENVTFVGNRGGSGASATDGVMPGDDIESLMSAAPGRGSSLSDAAGISVTEQQKTADDLMNQVAQIKKRAAAKKAEPANGSSSSDFSYQDQPPFEDQLPF